ncbi:elongation factor P maturation arginine rhamnosyltransferase EarP [Pseudomonas anguilliseptica]|uniref:elongation factor P maturation arginine rhamnosyltransferase EarP n=1 Tax=Pseudomonas anguilliseptica TaxID=53406 RepID=UPI0022B01D8A|nr:elongation factor P maturation arginine rhamnosyltransferase EarP [Pseudomonas anguilliseptica]MCZ4324179.1 elongation factor P maturation arginine rhamnosyltransferase EarP [Pseudomonas anguilliseptica]
MRATWDIFCSVVDNYGDIGVTWRLARQLVIEHGMAVRLWVDDLAAFVRLCPQADAMALLQVQQGVEVCLWCADWQAVEPADVVIEAFACELPASYIAAMAQRPQKPLWLNLEYLSAEDWVEGCHGLPSLQSNALSKFFFFPGFTAGSGGLLRERELLVQRRAFQADSGAREMFLRAIGVTPLPGARLISLFAYENAALASWLDVLATDTQINQLLVPEGCILANLEAWLGCTAMRAGDMQRRGQLHIQVLPFIQQDQYDRLLWSCDFNAVRGEDSFVRAQWAGRPLLWHIYEQADNAHLEKLDAFLALYKEGLSVDRERALVELWHAWNTGQSVKESWNQLLNHWPEQQAHAEQWCLQRASQADLAEALVQFYLNWL